MALIIVSRTIQYLGGTQYLYAVGDRQAIVQAIRNTYTKHQMPIHKEKDQTFFHYPSGWIDRSCSAFDRWRSINGGPESDCFSTYYEATNNPMVTLVKVVIYHKNGLFHKKQAQRRVDAFYEALVEEFGIFEIPLINAKNWHDMISQHPILRCSPDWG